MSQTEQKAAALELIRVAADAAKTYSLLYPEDAFTGLDFVPGEDAQPAKLDPLIEIRADGCGLSRDYLEVVEKARVSSDPLDVEWANHHARPWVQMPEMAQRSDITADQRADILQNCGRVAGIVGNRQTGWTDQRYAAQAYWPFRHDANRQPVEAIRDAGAYMEAKPQTGFPGAKLADAGFYARTHLETFKAGRRTNTQPIIGDNRPH